MRAPLHSIGLKGKSSNTAGSLKKKSVYPELQGKKQLKIIIGDEQDLQIFSLIRQKYRLNFCEHN
uniref:Uncharacterized protein n=1 Tax=Arion vulgaris TaxID=1028688 RepID=A0A0B6YPG7_9EUPU